MKYSASNEKGTDENLVLLSRFSCCALSVKVAVGKNYSTIHEAFAVSDRNRLVLQVNCQWSPVSPNLFHHVFYLRARCRAVACYRDPSSYYFYSRDGGADHGGVAVVVLHFWMKEEVDIEPFEPLRPVVFHPTSRRWKSSPLKLFDKNQVLNPWTLTGP